ncbi:hypothetical protein DM860_014068 [Cuscuta australis]|uniref:Uncharacterized protein n=1 Tax=Cuscuta australis TaxID=267555 RepID=A0A328DDF9_9ASTE|nr:hypothetical protein DM860_014068 [Cuscuta australis]
MAADSSDDPKLMSLKARCIPLTEEYELYLTSCGEVSYTHLAVFYSTSNCVSVSALNLCGISW